MRRLSTLLTLTLLAALSGCGRSPEQAQTPAGTAPATVATAKPSMVEPVEIVTRFLDALRRGGAENEAASLLTAAARAGCQRKQIQIQPVGSPDARFEVTRGEAVPGRTDAALVHCKWTEPATEGAPQSHEIVWALKLQPTDGWRISGMIVATESGEPVAIDFENGDELFSQLMGGAAPEASTTPAAQTAAAPTTTEATR